MKPFVKIALFTVTFFAIAAILGALYLFNLKHADMTKAKPDFVVSANALQKSFEEDEKAASTKYINKIVEVSGTITSVKQAENKVFNISLATESALSSVICTLPEVKDTSEFVTGKEITLRGECSGFLMDVLLNNCAVVKR